jgi:hypothetical protein
VASVPYTLNQNEIKSLANPAAIWSVGGDNGTEFYINFPDMPFGQQWVAPFTYGFMYTKDEAHVGGVTVDASKVPPWGTTPVVTTKQATLAAYSEAQPFSAGISGITSAWTPVGKYVVVGVGAEQFTTIPVPVDAKTLGLVIPPGNLNTVSIVGTTTGTIYMPTSTGLIGNGFITCNIDAARDSQYQVTWLASSGPPLIVYADTSSLFMGYPSLGSRPMAESVPVTLASDQPGIGTVGQKAMASSLPVAIASDQSPIPFFPSVLRGIAYASALRVVGATFTTIVQSFGCKGIRLYIDTGAEAGTTTVAIASEDPLGTSSYRTLLTSAALGPGLFKDLTVYPGTGVIANVSASDLIGENTFLALTVAGVSMTQRVQYELIP